MINKALQLIRKFGIDIVRIREPFAEQLKELDKVEVIFDIGANLGSYTERYSDFPDSRVFCFEPCNCTFDKLYKRLRSRENISFVNSGMGDRREDKKLNLYSDSGSNSFLESNQEDAKGFQICRVDTVDNFCKTHNIHQIDIMKIDVQGYDMEVLKGAEFMLMNKKIRLIYIEGNFDRQYKDSSTCFEIGKLLLSYGFKVRKLFNINYKDGFLTHADFMFTLQSKEEK